jgi:hypothetical protein
VCSSVQRAAQGTGISELRVGLGAAIEFAEACLERAGYTWRVHARRLLQTRGSHDREPAVKDAQRGTPVRGPRRAEIAPSVREDGGSKALRRNLRTQSASLPIASPRTGTRSAVRPRLSCSLRALTSVHTTYTIVYAVDVTVITEVLFTPEVIENCGLSTI